MSVNLDGSRELNEPLLVNASGLRKPKKQKSMSMGGLTAIAAIGGFLFGYDTGVVSGAMLLIIQDLNLEGETFKQELIVSSTLVGCIISAFAAKTITERYGRKPAVVMGSVVFILGAVMMSLARYCPSPFAMLVAGRFVVGIAVGVASMAVPLYIAELAPSHARGRLVALNTVFITGGQFISCIVAATLSKVWYPHGWQLMLGLAAVPAALQLIGMLGAPESPRWLMKYKTKEEAVQVLYGLRRDWSQTVKEIQEIEASLEQEKKESASSVSLYQMWSTPKLRRPLIIACSLQGIQQLTGINTVMYYSGTIVVMAGFTDTTMAIWITAIISFFGFTFTAISMCFVERAGRRGLTLFSLIAIAGTLAIMGGGFYGQMATSLPATPTPACNHSSCYACTADPACGYCFAGFNISSGGAGAGAGASSRSSAEDLFGPVRGAAAGGGGGGSFVYGGAGAGSTGICIPGNASAPSANSSFQCPNGTYNGQACPVAPGTFPFGFMSLVGAGLYLACFQVGMGQTPWVINSEIFPMNARSAGVSAATTVNWVGNLIISLTFLNLCKAISTYGAFWLYGAIAVAGWGWLYVKLPETRGKSLEEIGHLFE